MRRERMLLWMFSHGFLFSSLSVLFLVFSLNMNIAFLYLMMNVIQNTFVVAPSNSVALHDRMLIMLIPWVLSCSA